LKNNIFVLNKSFYTRLDVLQISKELLGKYIVTNIDGQRTVGMIVETEAYRAPDNKACHAYTNKRTERTEVMFREGGAAYVYLCYGIHHLFNVVTAEMNIAHAVLVRAIEPIEGVDIMLKRRKFTDNKPSLTNGPGKLCVALGIKTIFSGVSLTESLGVIYIEDRGTIISPSQIVAGPRVGIFGAKESRFWDWRFRIKDNPWTSKPNIVRYED